VMLGSVRSGGTESGVAGSIGRVAWVRWAGARDQSVRRVRFS
jgi:hypothetical protein